LRSRKADCSKCIYFRPLSQLSESEVINAYAWCHHSRPGEEPLGLCSYFKRPVTYLRGYCYAYRPKPEPIKKLEEFLVH